MALYRYDEATADIERDIELDPLSKEYCSTRGTIAKDLARQDEALEWFNKALAMGFNSSALRGRININLERHNYDEVLGDCGWLEKHEPTARVIMYRAEALKGLGRLDEALAECNRVLVEGNEDERRNWHYETRADVYLALGEPRKAYYDLATATAKHGETRDALLKLGDFFMDTHPDYYEAASYYTVLIEEKSFYVPETVPKDARHEPPAARLRRGQAYMALAARGATSAKRFTADALKDFTGYIALEPEDAKGYAERARAYVALGKRAKAEADLAKAIALDENNPDYKRQLDQITTGQDDTAEHKPSQHGGGPQ
jgi:tetratricopeptide (TPR) repeat protein